ncbi:hypothetical protein [Puia sp.]|jgi:predicted NBD/HSP70 family sugar kinase|uniref:hypothetical protein n=1 Tax=Puia sp. TaxID=2045100 RepID=UPI002F3EAD54
MSKHTNEIACGVDIGGTHISAALIRDHQLLTETYRRMPVDPAADARTLLDTWAGLINTVIGLAPAAEATAAPLSASRYPASVSRCPDPLIIPTASR